MADNFQFTEGSGTEMGADEISSVKFQRVKLIHGEDGSNDGDVAQSNGLPVTEAQAATAEDLVTILYSSLTASFAACSLSNIATSSQIMIWNDTDEAVFLNWDGGANAKHIVPARAARDIRVLDGSTELYIKYASAPSAGNVYIEVSS